MAVKIIPNQYDLRGQTVSISYSTSSITGEAQLSFKKGRQTLNFGGSEIGLVETSVGSLITVTIANVPDRNSTSFSFLLPVIELSGISGKQPFRAIGVTTIHKTSIGGPPKGVQQTYKTVELRGTAQRVAFVAKKAAHA
jgi:hypothetical protein